MTAPDFSATADDSAIYGKLLARISETSIAQMQKVPMLPKGEDFRLARLWLERGDKKALDRLVTAHWPMAFKIATQHRGYRIPVEDLFQAGCIGLMKAAYRFDPARGIAFATFANLRVRGEIQEYVLNHWSSVKLVTTETHKTLFFRLNRLRRKIGDAMGPLTRETAQKIANDLGVSIKSVFEMDEKITGKNTSPHIVHSDDGEKPFVDTLVSDEPLFDETLGERQEWDRRMASLRAALSQLAPQEKDIVENRSLKDEAEKATLGELGKKYGISGERVRQIEVRALEKVKRLLLAEKRNHALSQAARTTKIRRKSAPAQLTQ